MSPTAKNEPRKVIANTMAVPLQPVRTFGRNGNRRANMLIFGGDLQVIKTLVDMKRHAVRSQMLTVRRELGSLTSHPHSRTAVV